MFLVNQAFFSSFSCLLSAILLRVMDTTVESLKQQCRLSYDWYAASSRAERARDGSEKVEQEISGESAEVLIKR